MRHGLAFFRECEARFPAGFGLTIKRLRGGGRPAHFAENQDIDLVIAAIVPDLDEVADFYVSRRFDGLPIRLNSAQIACF